MSSKSGRKVHLISLGCPKNLVDSEYLLGRLTELGLEVTEIPEEAETIVVNTCGFLQSAVSEAVEVILEAAELKNTGAAKILAVTGCLPQRYKGDLAASLPEVDLFWGAGGLEDLARTLARGDLPAGNEHLDEIPPGFAPDSAGPRLRSAPFYRAYLKVAEGCDNACSYCLIPSLRGPYRSRPLETLVDEAHGLAESGVRELILVAQDTTAYGRGLGRKVNLARLLARLAEVDGLDWIRIMYAYPSGLTDQLLEVMAGEPKICEYLDLPLQHASPRVLKRMKRRGDFDYLKLIEKLKQKIPDLTLRTTLMVGFPGETDEDFETLLDFVDQAEFDRLGVFKFSPEEGSAAAVMADQVPQWLKEKRRRKLMARQRRISKKILSRLVGRTLPVLVEGKSPETDLLLTGRTRGMAPEIDGQVYIVSGTASAGEIRPALIARSLDYDLVGELDFDPEEAEGRSG